MSLAAGLGRDTIALTVLTPSVDIYETFRLDEPLDAVLAWALDATGYTKLRDEFLLLSDGELLDPRVPIGEYVRRFHWDDRTVLMLVRSHQHGNAEPLT